MEKFVFYSQFLILALYTFNTIAYVSLGQWVKAAYWLGATLLVGSVMRMD